MKKNFLLFVLFFCLVSQNIAQNYSLYGKISSSNGEFLSTVSVVVKNSKSGVCSNNYGFYSLTLPKGDYQVFFSLIGYQTIEKTIHLESNQKLDVELEEKNIESQGVVIKSNQDRVGDLSLGKQTMSIEKIHSLPAMMGEVDILKGLQLLPGIQSASEGSTNLCIRGGSHDQNLILLDEAPVYNAAHALSFFSVFNPDVLKSVTVYKGLFPPQYGGRTSSVIDIRMKEGNTKKFSVNGGIGLIASRLTVESPIFKGKGSFIVSGRYSYAGTVANAIGGTLQDAGMYELKDFNRNNEITFYDLNAKINYEINPNNHLYLSFYKGNDHFYYPDIKATSFATDWGNTTSTLRWNHTYNSKLFSNLSLIYSRYNYSYFFDDNSRRYHWLADMSLYQVKQDYDYYLNTSNHLKFGISANLNQYSPGRIEATDTSSITKSSALDNKKSSEVSLYVSNETEISDHLSINYGLRYTAFFVLGKGNVFSYSRDKTQIIDTTSYGSNQIMQFYNGFEPYFSVRYMLSSRSSIKAGFGHNYQYQHLISNSSLGLPTDVWTPADKYIKPQYSDNFSIGYFQNLCDNEYQFSVELYYRNLHQVIDYKDNADLVLNPHVETEILTGRGKAQGAEFMFEKTEGKLTGFVSYTLSKIQKQINGINDNQWFSPRYDKRHNLAVSMKYDFTQNWSFSSVFRYISGGYATIPEGSYYFQGVSVIYYSSRNGYTLPPFHTLDIAFTYSNKNSTSKYKSEWVFGINNVYNRKNVYSLYMAQENYDYPFRAYKMYLFRIVPSITYNFKF